VCIRERNLRYIVLFFFQGVGYRVEDQGSGFTKAQTRNNLQASQLLLKLASQKRIPDHGINIAFRNYSAQNMG
jgi:hypothetical protein